MTPRWSSSVLWFINREHLRTERDKMSLGRHFAERFEICISINSIINSWWPNDRIRSCTLAKFEGCFDTSSLSIWKIPGVPWDSLKSFRRGRPSVKEWPNQGIWNSGSAILFSLLFPASPVRSSHGHSIPMVVNPGIFRQESLFMAKSVSNRRSVLSSFSIETNTDWKRSKLL